MSLIARIRASHENHRRIASGALIIGLLTLVAKLFGALREMAIAWRFGVSSTVDAFQLAVTATTWLPNVLTGVMAVVLVPRLIKAERRGNDRDAFVAELNGNVALVGLVSALAIWSGASLIARMLGGGMDAGTLQLTRNMIARMAPVALLMLVSGYFYARLQSRERFGYTATEAVPALVLAIAVGLVAGSGPEALIYGTLIGNALQVLTLAALVVRGDPPLERMRVRHRAEAWGSLYGSLLLMVAAQLSITASIPIDQWFAAHLGEGAVASLGYANRIIILLTSLGTIIIGRALLPVLSSAVADGHVDLGRRQAVQWSLLLGGLGVVGAFLGWILMPEIVRLLFQRGSFDAVATARVADAAQWGLLQLPGYFAGIALVQWYAANDRFRAFLIINTIAIVLKIVLNVVLTPRLGLAGIMISTAAMYAVAACLFVILTRRGGAPR